MAGMKEGPGDDPFADDDEDDDLEPGTGMPEVDTGDNRTVAEEPDDADESMSTDQIPYVVRRQTVKEDRNRELVIFARDDFADLEDDVRSAVADELGMSNSDVPVTDIREAYIELASRHPGEMAEILDEWGFEHLK